MPLDRTQWRRTKQRAHQKKSRVLSCLFCARLHKHANKVSCMFLISKSRQFHATDQSEHEQHKRMATRRKKENRILCAPLLVAASEKVTYKRAKLVQTQHAHSLKFSRWGKRVHLFCSSLSLSLAHLFLSLHLRITLRKQWTINPIGRS